MDGLNGMFLIEGVIGEESENEYSNVKEMLEATHEFRSESIKRLDEQMEKEKKRADQSVAELKEDLLDYYKLQEREIQGLNKKLMQITGELEEVKAELAAAAEDDEEEEGEDDRSGSIHSKSERSKSSRHSRHKSSKELKEINTASDDKQSHKSSRSQSESIQMTGSKPVTSIVDSVPQT